MNVLVIGASGLLAKPVIRHMDKAGFKLRLFSRNVNPLMFDKEFGMVQGDVFNLNDLNKAMNGCDAVHISIATKNEGLATKNIVTVARQAGIKLISKVSGCTVAEENRWFTMIENKYQAEQSIISSGIPYMLFRPSWFFETLDLMIKGGKAMMLGKQQNPSHWVAAEDFARMVVAAYKNPDARNRIFFIFGQEQFFMKDLLEKYCKARYPGIKKVSIIPIWMVKFMAILSGNEGLKEAALLFGYFEKVKEMGNPDETNALLGNPTITFENWVQSNDGLQVYD